MRVLEEYFAQAGEITAENAWEHVYRCLLWMNQGAGLAHIYDSNHMQAGGNFHSRAVRFTDELCRLFGITHSQLPTNIDYLFKGCVTEWKRSRAAEELDPDIESELIFATEQLLRAEGVAEIRIRSLARQIEALSRDFFTIGNKRKNALGEGLEDLLYLLLRRVSRVPQERMALRTPVSQLPGFRAPARRPGARRPREPRPDIAIHERRITHVITTAKWSMRQDRETQFQAEYTAYQRNKTQQTELRFALITNEFDVARLNNVARAIPGGAGGYIFHQIYHINPELLIHTHGDRIGDVKHWIGAGKILSLNDFLLDMHDHFGASG